jgi:uncharacterized protein (TIGR03437 family)
MVRRVATALLAAGICVPAETPAPPAIDPGGIVNAASRMPGSLPGGAIASGARFLLSGVRLGPGDSVVRIRQGEKQIAAPILHAAAESLEGWIPPEVEPGPAELTVTCDGRSSDPYRLTIVGSSFGFFPPETPPPAAPGRTVTLEGTGAGSDPLRVFVGGKQATAVRVEHAAEGLDRVTIQVPADAPKGCAVPVQAVTPAGRASNTVSLAIHEPGRPCSDRVDWFREPAATARNMGFLILARVSFAPNRDFDYAFASFGREEAGRRPLPPLPPLDTCTLIAGSLNVRQVITRARNLGAPAAIPAAPRNPRLDAGPQIEIRGPAGAARLDREPRDPRYYAALLGGFPPFTRKPPRPLFLNPGAYKLRAEGGADIGPFTVRLRVPQPVRWTNRDRLDEVDRAIGVTVEWQAARKNSVVLIAAASADRFTGDAAACICAAASAEGRFQIPPQSLANLPPTTEENKQLSYLLLAEIPTDPSRINARSLQAAIAAYLSAAIRAITYK